MTSSFGDLVKGSAKGSLVLMIGQVITTIISAITIIWIARVIGQTSYGEYTVAIVPASLLLLLQDLGMNQALMRFCAMYRHEGRPGLRSIVLTGLLFSGATSLILSVMLYVFSGFLASAYLQRPEVAPLVQAVSLSILGNGLLSTVQAILAGYELMTLRSIAQILFSIVRGIVGVALILIGLGAFGAIISYTASLLLTGLVGVLLVFIFVRFKLGDGGMNFGTLKMLLTYGFPLSIGTILGGVLSQIYNSLIIFYASTDMIGNYGAAMNFGVLVSFLTVPIATVLFPLFSKFRRDDPQLKALFGSAVKYTSIVTLPVVLVIIVLAAPLSRVVFTTDYPFVPLYLSLYILTFAFEGLGGISLGNLISGIGESRVLLVSSVLTFMAGAALALLLVPSLQIVGLLLTMIVAPRAGWFYQMIWARKNIGFTVDWGATAKIYATAFAAFAAAYVVVNLPSLHGWVALVSGGLTYLIVYLIGLPLTGALRQGDFTLLETIVDTLGPLAPLARFILSLMSRMAR